MTCEISRPFPVRAFSAMHGDLETDFLKSVSYRAHTCSTGSHAFVLLKKFDALGFSS